MNIQQFVYQFIHRWIFKLFLVSAMGNSIAMNVKHNRQNNSIEWW